MTRRRSNRHRARRARRNRKRPAPFWRRLPGLRVVGRSVLFGLRRAVPALIAVSVTALVVFGGIYGYRFITTSERFSVQVIEVRGHHRVSAEKVKELVGTGIGDNIFGVKLADLEETLEVEPWIARATVSRRLPDTLIIEVTENQPAALVQLGGLYLADSDGVVFKRAVIELGEGSGLPVITGLSRDEYVADPGAIQARIVEALAAVAVYEESGRRRPALGAINIHPRHGVTFTTYERAVAVRVGHGDTDTLRQRLGTFDIAWQALSTEERERARIVYTDVGTRPDRVTIGFNTSSE